MASQPANTTIEVFRTIRMQRDDFLHTSVKHRITPFGDKIMNVPGEEILVTETRDASFVTDAFRFGHPVCVIPRTKSTFENAVENIADLQFPITLTGNPRDAFLTKTAGNNTDDLHQDLRDVVLSIKPLDDETRRPHVRRLEGLLSANQDRTTKTTDENQHGGDAESGAPLSDSHSFYHSTLQVRTTDPAGS